MGCGLGGTNHLRRGKWGEKGAKPYCQDPGDAPQLGYMWDRPTFNRMAAEGIACMACVRTLERDRLAKKLAEANRRRLKRGLRSVIR